MDEVYRNEAYGADEEAERIEELAAPYAAQDDGPRGRRRGPGWRGRMPFQSPAF